MVIEVPEAYKYVADRAAFVVLKRASNVAFMLSKHAEDETAEWLNSDLYERMASELAESVYERYELLVGVVEILTGRGMKEITRWQFTKENYRLEVTMNGEDS